MKNSDLSRNIRGLIVICAVLLVVSSLPLFLSARSRTTTPSIKVVNNSSRQILHIYLSHVDADDWSGNQLADSVISSGQSFTVTSFNCDQQQIKVIGEDQDGCFSSAVFSCSENSTWTITNDTSRDCGN